MHTKATTIRQYIAEQDKYLQKKLKEIYATIQKAAPKSEESISYGMPAFKFNEKPLAYFAAMKGHLGFYPTPGPIVHFKKDLADYSVGKGCIRFQYNSPLPLGLVKKIVEYRKKEFLAKWCD